MATTIQLQEYRSPIWKFLALFSGLITIIFLCAYFFISDVFWGGIFRLISFAGFAGVVLVMLKIRVRPKKIEARLIPENLIIHYFDDNEKVKEEFYERKTIKNIQRKNVSPAWDFLSDTNVYKHIISFTDTDTKLSIFIYNGRNIHLDENDSAKFETFLSQNDILFSHE